jgi:hypothetical protein
MIHQLPHQLLFTTFNLPEATSAAFLRLGMDIHAAKVNRHRGNHQWTAATVTTPDVSGPG